jgi:DNA-directed RNA polymerase subunit RPC12/RpoP
MRYICSCCGSILDEVDLIIDDEVKFCPDCGVLITDNDKIEEFYE